MKELKDKTAFVTGGSSGIGLAVSGLLASKGAGVIIFARDQEKLDYAVSCIKRMRAEETRYISSMRLDVRDHDEVARVMKAAVNEFSAPDLLINCAGRAVPDYFENIPYSRFEDTMKINFYGTWNVISAILPAMKARGGHIVNISSVGGYLGLFGYTDYCSSKFAVMGFSEALRSELRAYKIRVSVVCPPDTDTPGFHMENTTKPDETIKISGKIKPVSPEYVARNILEGIRKNRFIILPGNSVKLSYIIKRFLPSVMDLIINVSLNKTRRKRKIQSLAN